MSTGCSSPLSSICVSVSCENCRPSMRRRLQAADTCGSSRRQSRRSENLADDMSYRLPSSGRRSLTTHTHTQTGTHNYRRRHTRAHTSRLSESEGVCFYRRWFVCLSVCLSVTTITKKIVDGFVSNFMRRFLGGKWRPSSCFVTIGRCGSNGEKNSVNRRLFTFYTFSMCGKCCQVLATKPPNFAFAGSCTLSEYFPFSLTVRTFPYIGLQKHVPQTRKIPESLLWMEILF